MIECGNCELSQSTGLYENSGAPDQPCPVCRGTGEISPRFINLTPHDIVLNDGRVFPSSGQVARVSVSFSEFKDDICQQKFGEVIGLPAKPSRYEIYIVSGMVLSAAHKSSLEEGCGLYKYHQLVAPATGHPDCKRDSGGRIISVPGFVKE